MSHRRLLVGLALVVGIAGCSKDTDKKPVTRTPAAVAPVEDGAILFQGVRVFDGKEVLDGRDVLVRDGRIAKVGQDLDAAGAELIDGAGKTLVPGLIDAHAHVFDATQLQRAAIFGVTTVLDMGTDPKTAAKIKEQLTTPEGGQSADLLTAGNFVTAPGGHGTEYGIPVRTISGPDEAAAFVDKNLAEGSDYIKIIYDDGHAYGLEFPTLSKETMAAAIAAAHARDKLAIAHIGSQQGARDALEAGADGLAHIFVDTAPGPDFAAFVARNDAFVIPTLSVNQVIAGASGGPALAEDTALAPYLSAEDTASLKRSFPATKAVVEYAHAEETVQALQAAGVAILAGTDAPNPGTTYGASMHGEVALLVEAGLSPVEALAAATSVPAAHFALDDRGRIAADLRADLVLVDGDPTTDIAALRHIAGVWKEGVRIERDAYRSKLAADRARAAKEIGTPPPGSESGLVSDFDDGTPATSFGAGWAVSTDAMLGGASTAKLEVVSSGAEGSQGALRITGEIAAGKGPNTWAGATFSPGAEPMAPANLSSKKALSFWARGDGKTFAVMLFARSRGFMPTTLTFEAGKRWKQHIFPLAKFDGIDGRDLTGVFFGAVTPPGKFALQIDRVEFQ